MRGRDDVRRLREELDAVLRPVAKARPTARDLYKDRARARLRCIVEDAQRRGQSQREVARRAGIAEIYLRDMLAGRREIPAWIFDALPKESQVLDMRERLRALAENDDDEIVPASNGTDG